MIISSLGPLSGMSIAGLMPKGEGKTLADEPSYGTVMFQRERDFAQTRRQQ